MNTFLMFIIAGLTSFQAVYYEDLINIGPFVLSWFASSIGYSICVYFFKENKNEKKDRAPKKEILKWIVWFMSINVILTIIWVVLTKQSSVYLAGLGEVSYPIIILFIYSVFQKKKISWQQIVGAVCVVAGILIATS